VFAIAALHTATELLKQSVLDVAAHSEVIDPLRQEFKSLAEESGWTTTGLFKTELLDSVAKETRRLKPRALANLKRKRRYAPPWNDITLGMTTAVASSSTWNPAIYHNAKIYDSYRFKRLRKVWGRSAVLATMSPDHIRLASESRFFQLGHLLQTKLRLHLRGFLLSYDMRITDGAKGNKGVGFDFEMLPDPEAKLEVGRRHSQNDVLSVIYPLVQQIART
jgi:hypothetical protein